MHASQLILSRLLPLLFSPCRCKPPWHRTRSWRCCAPKVWGSPILNWERPSRRLHQARSAWRYKNRLSAFRVALRTVNGLPTCLGCNTRFFTLHALSPLQCHTLSPLQCHAALPGLLTVTPTQRSLALASPLHLSSTLHRVSHTSTLPFTPSSPGTPAPSPP